MLSKEVDITAAPFSMMYQPFNMVDFSDLYNVQDSVVLTCLDQSAHFTGSINMDIIDKSSLHFILFVNIDHGNVFNIQYSLQEKRYTKIIKNNISPTWLTIWAR